MPLSHCKHPQFNYTLISTLLTIKHFKYTNHIRRYPTPNSGSLDIRNKKCAYFVVDVVVVFVIVFLKHQNFQEIIKCRHQRYSKRSIILRIFMAEKRHDMHFGQNKNQMLNAFNRFQTKIALKMAGIIETEERNQKEMKDISNSDHQTVQTNIRAVAKRNRYHRTKQTALMCCIKPAQSTP